MGGHAARRQSPPAGNPGFAGYEYQVDVTLWVALDLIVGKEATVAVTIEPPSDEDIEAAVKNPDVASTQVTADSERMDLIIQIKSRSTAPWTSAALGPILRGEEPAAGTKKAVRRPRPLDMLVADSRRRYVFVTNESLAGPLRPHHGEHLLDFPKATALPPNSRKGYDAETQKSIAPHIVLCSDYTFERLKYRTERLLSDHGHVPSTNHQACIDELRAAIRLRMRGHAQGRLTRSDLLAILARHGGSVLPTRVMDHYVRPSSYDAIRQAIDLRHAVVISGPSGTGKTLTADILELELRVGSPPFSVIGEKGGPGDVRAALSRTDALLFHLRDPWGGNRLAPEADRWSNELPKLLQEAGAGRKFIITSRSDVLRSAGPALAKQLAPYTVSIEIEDYGHERLGEIYDRIGSDLAGDTAIRAKAFRSKALDSLTRPYEIDRFLIALSQESAAKPRRVEELIAESQIDAISSVVADQVAGWGADGVAAGAIIWAMLVARGAIARDSLTTPLRRMRAVEPMLRPDVDGLIDFLVAGRNLRQDSGVLAFYHPRVEDGLRMAIERLRLEAEHVLSRLADALLYGDREGSDWGAETVLAIQRAVSRLDGVTLTLADESHARLDNFLEAAIADANSSHEFERAIGDLARYGSFDHIPSRLARLLIDGAPRKRDRFTVAGWSAPQVAPAELAALTADSRTAPLVKRFVRDVLPSSSTIYDADFAEFAARLSPNIGPAFTDALDTVSTVAGPSMNVDPIVAGACLGDHPDFDGIIARFAQQEADTNDWFEGYSKEYRSAEEHEVDAVQADLIIEEPGERYFNAREGMKAVVQLRYAREGLEWLQDHPHRVLLAYALADIWGHRQSKASPLELRVLVGCADGWAKDHVWWAVSRHWDASLTDLLAGELVRTDLGNERHRHTLIQISASVGANPLQPLLDAAPGVGLARRLEMVCDVMLTALGSDAGDDAGFASRRARAEQLADSFAPLERDVARALIAALASESLGDVVAALPAEGLTVIANLLPTAPTSIAGPLCCLVAAAGVDPTQTADRLLATGNVDDGHAAVTALSIWGDAAALRGVLKHPCYTVRRAALERLVDVSEPAERADLAVMASDPSADVRLAWAEFMEERRWPEAIGSLVPLLGDRRDFSSDRGMTSGAVWPRFAVARTAARALGAYESLPVFSIDALLETAAGKISRDPFVACAALDALSGKDDERILSALVAALGSNGLRESPQHRPVAQAAAWAIFDRVAAGKATLTETQALDAACNAGPAVAGPLLVALGIADGVVGDTVLERLDREGLEARSELIRIAAAAAQTLPSRGTLPRHNLLARLANGETLDDFETTQRHELTTWSEGLSPNADVQGTTAWLVKTAFGLPIQDSENDPRAFHLPARIGVFTTRTLTPAREIYSGVDDGR